MRCSVIDCKKKTRAPSRHVCWKKYHMCPRHARDHYPDEYGVLFKRGKYFKSER